MYGCIQEISNLKQKGTDYRLEHIVIYWVHGSYVALHNLGWLCGILLYCCSFLFLVAGGQIAWFYTVGTFFFFKLFLILICFGQRDRA